MSRFHRILVVCDPSPESEAAVKVAIELARDHHARLTLLTIVPLLSSPFAEAIAVQPHLESAYDAALRRARDAIPNDLSVTTALRHGPPARRIAEWAEDHDLVVMGSRSGGRLAHALAGSVSRTVVNTLNTAVLLTPAASPLTDGTPGSRKACACGDGRGSPFQPPRQATL
jgi:nucleotide-binding universal stress UspA family protein